MKLYCCPNCFNDSFLQSEIEVKSKQKGNCSFCLTENISIIEPEELNNLFESVLDIYEKDENGKSLFKLLQEDWMIFCSDLNENNSNKLLDKISSINTNERYSPTYKEEKQNVEQWESFREELKHNNRFFPNNAPSVEMIRPFGKYIGEKLEKGKYLFRARVNVDGKPINIDAMGKPPKRKSTNGRANPIGIPYLYVASSPETAIAEIRGNKGERLSIARFEILEDLELADLRNPRITVTPFGLDDDELELIYTNLPFLELLGNELSKPIIPREANLEYLPSQYLSEIIKHIGFNGIIYKSSVSNGDNFVLFDDRKVQIVEVVQYQITDIITISKII